MHGASMRTDSRIAFTITSRPRRTVEHNSPKTSENLLRQGIKETDTRAVLSRPLKDLALPDSNILSVLSPRQNRKLNFVALPIMTPESDPAPITCPRLEDPSFKDRSGAEASRVSKRPNERFEIFGYTSKVQY